MARVDDPIVATTIVTKADIPFDTRAIEHFQTLSQQSKFRKVGRGDLLIGSIALAHRATLVTRNVKDFDRIPNLKIVNWMN